MASCATTTASLKRARRNLITPGRTKRVHEYQGSGGIPVGSFWRRLLFALRFSENNILFSRIHAAGSRIMIYRRVLDSCPAAGAVFIYYDRHPYMVVASDGSLQWIWTRTRPPRHYPYSEPTPGVGQLHTQLRQESPSAPMTDG